MNVIVMGTGPFAVPTLRWLMDSTHNVLLLVTRPIRDAGRRRKTLANPMRDLAEARHLNLIDPDDVNTPEVIAELTQYDADLFVVCDYGQILSRDCLAASRQGGINLHGSLLPKYRGAAPIQWAIYHGETTTGVSVIHMTPQLDAGPCLVQTAVQIGDTETAGQLEPRLAECGVQAVAQAIDLLADWDGSSALGVIQNSAQATRAPRLTRSHGQIDWTRSAHAIANQIRAFQPWPGSFTHWNDPRGGALRLIIHQAVPLVENRPVTEPGRRDSGRVTQVSDAGMEVVTGDGNLLVQQLQPAGKRIMSVAEFLRGRTVKIGDALGPGPGKK